MIEVYGSKFWRDIREKYPNKTVIIINPIFDGSDIIGGEFYNAYDDSDAMCDAFEKLKKEGKDVMCRGTGDDVGVLFM